MGKARDFKFSVHIDCQAYKSKKVKVGQEGHDLRYVTYFYNFGPPFISPKWLKLETSNLVRTLSVRPANQKNAKVGHKGRGLRYVVYFYNFGTCSISVEWIKLETSI